MQQVIKQLFPKGNPLSSLYAELGEEPDAKALFHERAEAMLREFARCIGIKATLDVRHTWGTPAMIGYVQALTPSVGIEIGSHAVNDDVAVRFSHRRPGMKAFGLEIVELPIEEIYFPDRCLKAMTDRGIHVTPAPVGDDD